MTTKAEIDLNLDAFIASLKDWDGVTPSFRDAMAGALLHDALLGFGDIAVELGPGTLHCATSTVWRWARGSTAPMPAFREDAVAGAAEILERRKKDAERIHREAHAAFRRMSLAAQDAMEDGSGDD